MVDLPPESAGWSRRETCLSGSTYRDARALGGALRDGWTVVVNVRKSGPHKHLVPWLQEAGLLTYVGHAGPRHSWPESDCANPYLGMARIDRPGLVRRYRQWLAERPELLQRIREGELTGRALGCWCAPESCHADVLAEEANRGAADRRPG